LSLTLSVKFNQDVSVKEKFMEKVFLDIWKLVIAIVLVLIVNTFKLNKNKMKFIS